MGLVCPSQLLDETNENNHRICPLPDSTQLSTKPGFLILFPKSPNRSPDPTTPAPNSPFLSSAPMPSSPGLNKPARLGGRCWVVFGPCGDRWVGTLVTQSGAWHMSSATPVSPGKVTFAVWALWCASFSLGDGARLFRVPCFGGLWSLLLTPPPCGNGLSSISSSA